MLFYAFFKTLVGKEVAVELKNDVALTGVLHSVDQYLNMKLVQVRVVDAQRYPQLAAMSTVFVRGSVVRYIQVPAAEVDTELLQDATRKEMASASNATAAAAGSGQTAGGRGGGRGGGGRGRGGRGGGGRNK